MMVTSNRLNSQMTLALSGVIRAASPTVADLHDKLPLNAKYKLVTPSLLTNRGPQEKGGYHAQRKYIPNFDI